MKIKSAEFLKSAMLPSQFPRDGRPEFAFAGRSNVGKSSLLNRLLNRRGLAKTSSTPGKTQTINFFTVNDAIYLVDLPGYGYAKVPRDVKQKWQQAMHDYLTNRPPLRMVVQLVDSRHEPSDKDAEMLALLETAKVPALIVATKVDKLTKSERAANIRLIYKGLELDPDALVVPFSAISGEGVEEIWRVIEELM
jgi:GTP-binding protein